MLAEGQNATRVLIVDGDVLVRDGVTARLRAHDDLLVVAQAFSVDSAISESIRYKPDVAVLDADVIVGRGIDLCAQIKAVSPDTRCIIHAATAFITDDTKGADAVVLKQLFGDGLADTVRHITRARC